MNDRLISIKESASRLGISVRTLYRMIADKQIPEPIKIRSRSMIPERCLDAITRGASKGQR